MKEHIVYEYRNYLDLADLKTQHLLSLVEAEFATILCDNVEEKEDEAETIKARLELLAVLMAKLIATSSSTNEFMQAALDAMVTLTRQYDKNYTAEVHQCRDGEEWVIKGRDLDADNTIEFHQN